MIFGKEKGPEVIGVVARDVVFFQGGTSGSNPLRSSGESATNRAAAGDPGAASSSDEALTGRIVALRDGAVGIFPRVGSMCSERPSRQIIISG